MHLKINLHARVHTIVLTGILLLCAVRTHAQRMSVDSCGLNDTCGKAIVFPDVVSDQAFVCIEGCNLNAGSPPFNNYCGIGDFPTVWFEVTSDGSATLMNINVKSDAFDAPTITLFHFLSDCSNLQNIGLTQNQLSCILGSNGEAEAIGSAIGSNEIYYIAVSSFNSLGGHFDICVNTISQGSLCVQGAQIQITARSEGGLLDGPFLPGETVSVCMNVNSYSAAGNGCQWFQGLIPVFGNGWDPSSFDFNQQPKNATVNGHNMGVAGNGLYGTSTWDWFTGIGYHFDNTRLQIGYLDGNVTVEMCNLLYDVDCPDLGGITGGCCGPCWANAGDPLPPGWFAYGINGTCPTLGPPPTVDWGDGNTCGGGMGPWHFCFDLQVRNYPDCIIDPSTRDLTLGFFTTADGETGSWTGGESKCALDQPYKLTLPMLCRTVNHLETEELPDACAGSTFHYQIFESGIELWKWNISPYFSVTDTVSQSANGYMIESHLNNPFNHPINVTYTFTGYMHGQDVVKKEVNFTILPYIIISLPHIISICEDEQGTLVIRADTITGGNNSYSYFWSSTDTTSSINVLPPFHNSHYRLLVTDSIGCTGQAEVEIKLKPCLIDIDTTLPNDESNDDPKKEDPPASGGNVVNNHINTRSVSVSDEENIKIYPIPSKDRITVEWPKSLLHPTQIFICDTKGILLRTLIVDQHAINRMEINISDLTLGVYFLTLQSEHNVKSAQFIKM